MSGARKTWPTVLALAAVALAQTAVLAYMAIDRIQLLRAGREIVLSVRPYDPRDLFRGEYAFLNYFITTAPFAPGEAGRIKRNDTVYVTLEKSADSQWRTVEVRRAFRPDDNPDRIVLKGRAMWETAGSIAVRYGIERYFVRQGEGPKLEALTRESKLAVLVAVGRDGSAAIKGLIIDGKLQYEEPLL